MKIEIKKVDVKIEQPKLQQITAESHPEIWALLQPPMETEESYMTPPVLRQPYPSY